MSIPDSALTGGLGRAGRAVRAHDRIVTGEAVAIDLRVARLGSRLLGTLIDLGVQSFVLSNVITVVALLNPGHDSAFVAALSLVGYVLVIVGYPVLMETLWHGRTVGKAVMGLRVVRDDGGPVRFRQVLGRALVRAVVELPTFGILSMVSALVSRRSKRLGDLLVGTIAVQERMPVAAVVSLPMPPPLAGWARSLDLSRLSDALAMSSRQLLARAGSLEAASRERLGMEVVAAVQRCVTPPPPVGTPGWAYLAAVLAERRRRESERLGQPLDVVGVSGAPGAGRVPGYGVVLSTWGAPAAPAGWAPAPPPPAPARFPAPLQPPAAPRPGAEPPPPRAQPDLSAAPDEGPFARPG